MDYSNDDHRLERSKPNANVIHKTNTRSNMILSPTLISALPPLLLFTLAMVVVITTVVEVLAATAAVAVAVVLMSPVLLMVPNITSDIKDPSAEFVMSVRLALLLEDFCW